MKFSFSILEVYNISVLLCVTVYTSESEIKEICTTALLDNILQSK